MTAGASTSVSTSVRERETTMTMDAAPPLATAATPPGPHTRIAVRALVVATLAIGAAYGTALATETLPAWTPWLMALGVPVALVAVMVLGAARHGRVPTSLLAAFALVGCMLAGGFALALALPGGGAGVVGEPLLLGLPRRAAIIVYGIGLLPVLVLPVAYALTFEAQTLRDEDLARVRAAASAAADARRAEVAP